MRVVNNGAVTSVYLDVKVGWEQWVFLTSDNHFDSIYCHRDYLIGDLDEMKKRNAIGFVFGDWFDAMQGRYDPRRSNNELREEYRVDNYYDVVVADSAKFLEPYAHNFAMMCMGNHEQSVVKAANTNLLDRTVEMLNLRTGSSIVRGGYGGWVRFMFTIDGNPLGSIKLKYFHGSGGEAPVTRGAIQTNRQAVYLPDANLVVNGHSHNSYYIPITRERISNKGVQYFDTQFHLRIPGYKNGYADGTGGWEAERGGVPKPIGSWWVKLAYTSQGLRVIPSQELHEPYPVAPAIPDYMMPQPEPYGEDDRIE